MFIDGNTRYFLLKLESISFSYAKLLISIHITSLFLIFQQTIQKK